jgi:hypothetical protein
MEGYPGSCYNRCSPHQIEKGIFLYDLARPNVFEVRSFGASWKDAGFLPETLLVERDFYSECQVAVEEDMPFAEA